MCVSPSLPALTSSEFDRRVLLKAAASFSAMTLGVATLRPEEAAANSVTTSRTWVEVENPDVDLDSETGYRDVALLAPVSAIAPIWDQDAGTDITFEVALRWADGSWSESVSIAESIHDAGQRDRIGRRFGDLLIAEGATGFRYRAWNGSGRVDSVPGLAFALIDATVGPTIEDVAAVAIGGEVWSPPVISRAAWGADETYRFDSRDNEFWPLEYRDVAHVIIHHTETVSFQNPLAAIRSIYYYHAVERGWGDIGYNYLVDHMGNVYEGRYGGENVVGGHAYEYAYGSSGIGVMGSFGQSETTPEAQAGIVWITAWTGRYLDPFGSADFHDTDDCPTICAHRDVNPTACPGSGLYGQLDRIRSLVAEVIAGANPAVEPQFYVGDLVQVQIEGANVRNGPGIDWDVTMTVPFGVQFTITEGATTTDGATFYGVEGDWGWGWMAGDMLTLVDTATIAEDGLAVGDEVVVATDYLNLRSEPGRESYVVATMPTGTIASVIGGPVRADGYQWHELTSDYGTGWSIGSYLALRGAGIIFVPGEEATVATDELALRTGPGSSFRRKAVIAGGETVDILDGPERADARDWYQVRTIRSGTGWVAGTWLAPA
jgi:uncharacterized protein YgiM (DUF1202 family)